LKGEKCFFSFISIIFVLHRLQRKVESCFGPTLLLQSSSISFFLCILVYGVINSPAKENPYIFIYFIGFTLLAFSKISIPHVFGQRIINRSEALVDAIYAQPWYNYNNLQRKSLNTLMIYNQEESVINVMGFYDLDLDNLGKVMRNWEWEIDSRIDTIHFLAIHRFSKLHTPSTPFSKEWLNKLR
jgi:hypothetical protein